MFDKYWLPLPKDFLGSFLLFDGTAPVHFRPSSIFRLLILMVLTIPLVLKNKTRIITFTLFFSTLPFSFSFNKENCAHSWHLHECRSKLHYFPNFLCFSKLIFLVKCQKLSLVRPGKSLHFWLSFARQHASMLAYIAYRIVYEKAE